MREKNVFSSPVIAIPMVVILFIVTMVLLAHVEEMPLRTYEIVTANSKAITVQFEECKVKGDTSFLGLEPQSTYLNIVCYTSHKLSYEVLALSIREIP